MNWLRRRLIKLLVGKMVVIINADISNKNMSIGPNSTVYFDNSRINYITTDTKEGLVTLGNKDETTL